MNNYDESNGNEVVAEDSGRCQSCSCISSIKNKMRATTVEPVMFLYSVTMMLTMSSVTNLLLERVCLVIYHEDAETCHNMSSNATLHENIQTYTATLEMYLTLIMNLPSLLIGLIAGAYSDIHGRKVPLLMPLVGTTIQCIGLIVFSYLERLDPRWILLCGVPNALTGGFTVFIMAIFSYMSDISKQRSRTGRIGGLSIAFYIGSMLGYYLSNVILQYLGYWPLFTISAALSAINVLYVAICVKNYIVTSAEPVENIPSQRSLLYHCWQSTVSAAHACVRGRLLYTRAVLLILITSLTLFTFSFHISSFMFLYVQFKFHWQFNDFIYYSVFTTGFSCIVTTAVLSIASYKLGVNDYLLGLVSLALKLTSLVLIAFAPYSYLMYISAMIGCVDMVPSIVARSALSKILAPSELGKVFAVISSLESLTPLVSAPIYTAVYNNTISWLPGAVYLLTALVCLIMFINFIIVLALQRRGLFETYAQQETLINNTDAPGVQDANDDSTPILNSSYTPAAYS